MSAFIVDKKHIDLIVTGIRFGTRDGILAAWEKVDCNRLGAELVKENFASVNFRYSESDKPDEPYLYEHPNYIPTIEEMYDAVSCLDYQSCEHPGWKDSAARQWCELVNVCVPALVKARTSYAQWEFTAESIAILAAAQHADGLQLAVAASRDKSAVGPLSDWCMERGLLSEPLPEGTRISVDEPQENANARRAAERGQHAKDYPHLTTKASKPDYSPGKLAAANMRKELKTAFPGVKFSVTSDYNSVDVRWTCGPTDAAVSRIVTKYKAGNFNGMEDIYEEDADNTFADVFGDPKYVSTIRSYPESQLEVVWKQLAEFHGKPYTGQWTTVSDRLSASDLAHRILHNSALGATLNGVRRVEGVTAGSHEDFWEAY